MPGSFNGGSNRRLGPKRVGRHHASGGDTRQGIVHTLNIVRWQVGSSSVEILGDTPHETPVAMTSNECVRGPVLTRDRGTEKAVPKAKGYRHLCPLEREYCV